MRRVSESPVEELTFRCLRSIRVEMPEVQPFCLPLGGEAREIASMNIITF